MNLADMLVFADIHQLSRIANNYECECNGNSKNDLIQSILSMVNRREVFEHHIDRLSLEDLRFLNSLLYDQRTDFSLEELIARVQQTKFAEGGEACDSSSPSSTNPRDVIAKFKQYGWLFNGYSQQTKYLFQVPQDLKKRFGDTLAKQFEQKLTVVEEPQMYRDEQMMILEDIYVFLHYLHDQDVALTADGTMYKRNLQQILDRFAVREEPVGRVGWRFGYGRRFKDYPNRFSFVYDYCHFHELISEQGDQLCLTSIGKERVTNGQRELLTQVYRFWLRLYKGAIPNLLSLVHWVERLSRKWVTFHSLYQVIGPFIKPFYYDSSESIMEQRIVQMMMHLGLVRVGEAEGFGKTVMVTKLGSGVIHGVYVPHEDKIELAPER